MHVPPSARVLVLGDGKLGTLIAMVLVRSGAEVTVLGRHARKLERLRAAGARAVLAGEPIDAGFDVVVEATGSPEGLPRAQALLRPRGTLVLKSTFHGHTELFTAPIVIDELSIVGSRCGPFAPAVRALAAGIDPSPLIEATYPLADGARALERAAEPGAAKVLIAPGAH
ncbi:MAG: zinc-binding dehydrogenase [Sandaracinaceae bacterium]|nr:zinc-binding dehydrogenase [Sandaracinaceae bacterium]